MKKVDKDVGLKVLSSPSYHCAAEQIPLSRRGGADVQPGYPSRHAMWIHTRLRSSLWLGCRMLRAEGIPSRPGRVHPARYLYPQIPRWQHNKQLTSVCQMPCKWPGTFGHGGAWGTQCWIDPAAGAAYLLFVQRNNFGASTSERPGLRQQNADNTPARADFQAAAAKAVRLNKL